LEQNHLGCKRSSRFAACAAAESTNDRVKWGSIAQCGAMVGLSLVQAVYLRRGFEVCRCGIGNIAAQQILRIQKKLHTHSHTHGHIHSQTHTLTHTHTHSHTSSPSPPPRPPPPPLMSFHESTNISTKVHYFSRRSAASDEEDGDRQIAALGTRANIPPVHTLTHPSGF